MSSGSGWGYTASRPHPNPEIEEFFQDIESRSAFRFVAGERPGEWLMRYPNGRTTGLQINEGQTMDAPYMAGLKAQLEQYIKEG